MLFAKVVFLNRLIVKPQLKMFGIPQVVVSKCKTLGLWLLLFYFKMSLLIFFCGVE